MDQDRQREIAALLAQAEAAHGEYETRELGGATDADWPRWYATYVLEHGLGALLPGETAPEQLANWLAACSEAYQREHAAEHWSTYYARRLLAGLT